MRARGLLIVAGLLSLPAASQAVIVYGPQGRNTTAPTGTLTNSGWQYQGQWGAYLGTPISSQLFITAEHVGGSVGQVFTYQSVPYTTTALYDDPNSDLRIWRVSGTFPSYAPLYTATDELTKPLVTFGRGTQRGGVVSVSGVDKGWLWGTQDGVQSWGQNIVSGTVPDATYGDQLVFDFAAGDANEGALSSGDSGGGVFINDGTTWRLAAINLGSTGPYKYQPDDLTSFNASLYDQSGLYVQDGDNWVPASGPGESSATRISTNMLWINSVIPEPTSLMLVGIAGLLLARRSRRMDP